MYEEFTGRNVPTRYASIDRYSPLLSSQLELLAANQPLSLDWVLEMAAKAGLHASKVGITAYSSAAPGVTLSADHVSEVFTANGTTIVWYPVMKSGALTITLLPAIRVQGDPDNRRLGENLLRAAGIESRTITFSEALIHLETPDWAKMQDVIQQPKYWCFQREVPIYKAIFHRLFDERS